MDEISREHALLSAHISHDRSLELSGEYLVQRRFGHVQRLRDILRRTDPDPILAQPAAAAGFSADFI